METFARPISSGTRPRKIPKRPDLVLWGSEDHSSTKKIRNRTISGVFGLWFAKRIESEDSEGKKKEKFRIFPEISRKWMELLSFNSPARPSTSTRPTEGRIFVFWSNKNRTLPITATLRRIFVFWSNKNRTLPITAIYVDQNNRGEDFRILE